MRRNASTAADANDWIKNNTTSTDPQLCNSSARQRNVGTMAATAVVSALYPILAYAGASQFMVNILSAGGSSLRGVSP